MNPSEKLKEIESRAVKLPNGKHLAVADSAVTEWLIQRVRTLEAALRESLELDLCRGTSCPHPCRAMCNNESHKVRRKALEGES